VDLFKRCLKLLKQYRTIEQMCSDAHSITLTSRLMFLFVLQRNCECYKISPWCCKQSYKWGPFIRKWQQTGKQL